MQAVALCTAAFWACWGLCSFNLRTASSLSSLQPFTL
jgi:hypothetical protein